MKYLFVGAILILVIPNSAVAGQQASLTLQQNDRNIKIYLNTSDQAINAVGIVINYDPEKVLVSDLNFDKSFCELFIEQVIDNQNGQIRIFCGLPTPGFSGKSSVASFSFKNLTDKASFSFDDETQVLANDGFGTNIRAKTNNLNIHFPTEPKVEPAIVERQWIISEALNSQSLTNA